MERKNGDGFVYTPDLFDLELDLLGARCNSLLRDGNSGDNLDDGLLGDLSSICDHALADLALLNEEDGLDSCVSLSSNKESRLALSTSVVDTTSDTNLLILVGSIQVLNFSVDLLESNLWVTLRSVELTVTKLVSARVVWVLDELILLRLFFLAFTKAFLFLGFLSSFLLSGCLFLGISLCLFGGSGFSISCNLLGGLLDGSNFLLGSLLGLSVFSHVCFGGERFVRESCRQKF